MAINFEQARYVDPNVDIKGTKIPWPQWIKVLRN